MAGRATIKYRRDIDGLRALAVVPVLLFHSGLPLFQGGFVGVDIFFVISGFLISKIIWTELQENRFSVLRFYERRARRILPALFVVIAACFLIGYRLMLATHYGSFAQSAIAAVLSVSNIFFWRQSGYFAPDLNFAPLLHTWSLGVEEQFYLLFPLVLILVRGAPTNINRALWLLLVVAFAGSVYLSFTRPFGAFYLLPARIWELLIGALLGIGAVPPLTRRASEWVGLAGLASVVGSVFLINAQQPFPGFVALLPCLGAAALLHSGVQSTVTARLLSWQPLVFIGLISYSLYLWHWPIFSFARMLTAAIDLGWQAILGALLTSFVLATVSWHFVERPFRDARRWPAKAIARFSVGGALVLISAGFVVTCFNGLPARLSPPVLAAQAAALDIDPLRTPCTGYETGGRTRECRFGPGQGDPSYVIIGDSHAAALRPAIEYAMAGKGRGTLWWYQGCPPLLGAVMVPMNDPACDAFRQHFLADLARSPSIHTVFLASRWAPLVSGTVPEIGGTLRTFLRDEMTTDITAQETLRVFERSLDRTIHQMRALGKTVVVIGSVPEPGFDVPSILALARHNGVGQVRSNTMERARLAEAPAGTVLNMISKREGALYVPLLAPFCAVVCALESAGRPLYSDSNHLSLHATRDVLGPWLKNTGLPQIAPQGDARR
jgi:peptidoglycan/LPS O-acetylase OafA/YrhL